MTKTDGAQIWSTWIVFQDHMKHDT